LLLLLLLLLSSTFENQYQFLHHVGIGLPAIHLAADTLLELWSAVRVAMRTSAQPTVERHAPFLLAGSCR